MTYQPECNPYKEFGLRLPNGDVHWGSYLNRPIRTEEERSVMAVVLHKTAQECGFDEDEFVSRYGWVSRTVDVHADSWDIDDPEVAPSPEEAERRRVVESVTPTKAPTKRARSKRVPMNTASR